MKNILALILIYTFLAGAPQTASAQTKGDWSAVKNLIGEEIAVETNGGRKAFGILRAAGDDALEMQIAEKKTLAAASTTFTRSEIVKLWRAKLRFGGRQTGRGALYGAGAGAVIGFFSRKKHRTRELVYSN